MPRGGRSVNRGSHALTTALYAVAAVVPVSEPELTATLLVESLGFQRREDEAGGTVVVDNGALVLRLARRDEGPLGGPAVALEVETDDLDGAVETLRRDGRVLSVDTDRRPRTDRVVRRVELAAEVVVYLVRTLSEDDLGVLPPLPSSLVWHERGDEIVRRVLCSVPLLFRRAARERVTRRAEAIALEAGLVEVGVLPAVRGLVEATPKFQHGTLRRALREQGVDISNLLGDDEEQE